MKVFISMNAKGELVITPAKRHRAKQEELKHDTELAEFSVLFKNQPGELDSRGRLKLPAALREFLLGD